MGRRLGWRRMGSQPCPICKLHVAWAWMNRHFNAGCESMVAVTKDNIYNENRIKELGWGA